MKHPPETKAAVMAALLEGQAVTAVAKEHSIPTSTISRWKADAFERAQKNDEIGNLLLDYIIASLKALLAQLEAFSDVEWLKSQSASDDAVLHGVQFDKLVRLLEAFSASPLSPGGPHV